MTSGTDVTRGDSNQPVVIITGGGSGIGRATAELFALQGARLVLVGRRPEPLQQVAATVSDLGSTALTLAQDITLPGTAAAVVGKTMERFAGVDILINNAGVPGEGVPLDRVSDALWEEIVSTNLTAAFRMLRATLPVFTKQRHGVVVNVASTAALKAMTNMAVYGAAKAALIALTRSVARDFASVGVRCNAVCPGTTDTPMTRNVLDGSELERRVLASIPLGRAAEPIEIAQVIVQLCNVSWTYITGTILTVDGGQTVQ